MEMAAARLRMAEDCTEHGHIGDALFALDIALALLPNSPHVHWNRAQALLSLGDYAEGFKEFEWRHRLFGDPFAASGLPMWRGEDLDGRRLLLYHEHGYGDSLMMFRFVPELKKQHGALVTLLLPTALTRIARQLGVEVLDKPPSDYRRFDYRCPMFSVIAALGHGVNDIPKAPYITGSRIKPLAVKPNSIGIAWSGNRAHLRDKHRSIDLDLFLSSLEWQGALYSVQDTENDQAASVGVIAGDFGDFADTAELMARLDHIVTVDTAAAHLAGAMGHPSAHVLLPYSSDWRWYNAQAWYPTLKVHRQDAPGDWESAFEKVNAATGG